MKNTAERIWFPHYTWGYIANPRKRLLLSSCSLTIREGISPNIRRRKRLRGFPHYTWGYIDCLAIRQRRQWVPSLYVRVYRLTPYISWIFNCSLTIREGISADRQRELRGLKFPHYTWGYIVLIMPIFQVLRVPSLYVRVYRILGIPFAGRPRSLTIREGISGYCGVSYRLD